MPVVQDSYRSTMRAGRHGMPVNQEPYNIITRLAQGVVPYGRAVVQGTADNEAKVPTAGGTFKGISVTDVAREAPAPNTVEQYADGENFGLMNRGVIWIEVPSPVVAGGNVYFANATGRLSSITEASTQIANAVWDSSAAAGQLAKLRLKAS